MNQHSIRKLKSVRVCSCGRIFNSKEDAAGHRKTFLTRKEEVDGDKTTDGQGDGVPEKESGAEA